MRSLPEAGIQIFAFLFLCCVPGVVSAGEMQFFGDVLLSRGIEAMIAHQGSDVFWRGTADLFKRDAVTIANLEGAVGTRSQCVPKKEPCFPIDSANIDVLNRFDVVSLANNHSLDLDLHGLTVTSQELRKRKIILLTNDTLSTIIRTQDGDIGILALTDVLNASDDKKLFAEPDSQKTMALIKELKAKTSLVAVYIHWGKELEAFPTDRMRRLSSGFIAAGADLVVGHHPHVVGEVECIKGKPVVYSLGNFLFDQKYEDTKKGAVLRCSFSAEDSFTCIMIGTQTPMNAFVPSMVPDDDTISRENKTLKACSFPVTPTWSDRFSSNKNKSRLVLKKVNDGSHLSTIELQEIKRQQGIFQSPQMPIEKLQPVDINNDGVQEILLIQKMYSSIDEEIAKRVYLYSLDSGMKALWRGSALSRPLLDAYFVSPSVDETPVLFALHSTDSFLMRNKTKQGRIVMSYRWNGFGFDGIKEKRFDISADYLSLVKMDINLVDKKRGIVKAVKVKDMY